MIEVIHRAMRVLELAIGRKQLEGEEGTAEEVTEEYRLLLLAILAAWIARNRGLPLSDRPAVQAALDELASRLEQAAIEELPVAFSAGFGEEITDFAEIVDLGALATANQQFLQGSLIPYMQGELADETLTLGQAAALRDFAWTTRVGLYSGLFWTALWAGVGARLRRDLEADVTPVRRLLDPRAEHCGTCPDKAREYGSWNEMLAFCGGLPADSSDECRSNCRCSIEVMQNGEWVGYA